jgi:SPP1 gp7 family putative phage head morphogenesis protein
VHPIFQNHSDEFANGPGNCMQAAAASLLDLQLDQVPNFIEDSDPDAAMREFFRKRGFDLVEKPAGFVPPGYYFETGISVHGSGHIVVCRSGCLMHDPNPLGMGLIKHESVLWPKPLTAKATHIVMDQKSSRIKPPGDLVLKPIYSNAGVRQWYRLELQKFARSMAIDVLRLMKKHYRPASDRLSMDDDPIVTLRTLLRRWGEKWEKRFDRMSADIARLFADRSQRHLEIAFRRRLREAGFTVRFRPSEKSVSAYRAVIAENVGLIRSIPRKFLNEVQTSVWSSVMKGGALGELTTDIRKKYGITYRRAALIARDQSAKAKAVMEQARRSELGIETAVWQHSGAGRKPRPTHQAMSGKRYPVKVGMWDSDEQKYVLPGELINCRCTSRAVLPGR